MVDWFAFRSFRVLGLEVIPHRFAEIVPPRLGVGLLGSGVWAPAFVPQFGAEGLTGG